MIKKILSVLLALTLCLSLFPTIVFATGAGTFKYTGEYATNANVVFAELDPYGEINEGVEPTFDGVITSIAEGYTLGGWRISINGGEFVDYTDNYYDLATYSLFVWIGKAGSDWVRTNLFGFYTDIEELGGVLTSWGGPTSVIVEPIIISTSSGLNVTVISNDLTKGSVEEAQPLANNQYRLTAIPKIDYTLDFWEAADGSDAIDGFTKIEGSDNQKSITVTVEKDMTYRAVFGSVRIEFVGSSDLTVVAFNGTYKENANLSKNTSLPDEKIEIGSSELGTYSAFQKYLPNPIKATIGEPARLLIPWKLTGDLKYRNGTNDLLHTIRFILYEGTDVLGVPLIDSGIRKLSSGNRFIDYISCDRPEDVYFNFIMPAVENFTVSIQLDDQVPVIKTFDTGLDAALLNRIVELNNTYNTPANIKWQYLIKDTLREASENGVGITDNGEINTIVQAAEDKILRYINGEAINGSDYIEVVFQIDKMLPPSLVRVKAGITQQEAMMAALDQQYPPGNPHGTWYIDANPGAFGLFVNDFGVDPTGTLSGIVNTYYRFASGITYGVNGFFANLGISSWIVKDHEIFTWSNTGNNPVQYTIPIFTDSFTMRGLWAIAVMRDEGITLTDIENAIKSGYNTIPLFITYFKDIDARGIDLSSRLGAGADLGAPDDFKNDAKVIAAKNAIDALNESSTEAEIKAARAEYGKIDSALYKYYFQNYEPYKTAYEKLIAAEVSAGIVAPLPDVSPSEALTGVLAYLKTTTPGFGSVGGEWAALALARGGAMTNGWKSAYLAALNSAINSSNPSIISDLNKTTTKERIVLALTAMGIDASDDFTDFLDDIANNAASGAGVNDRIFGLLALNSMPYNNYAAAIGTITPDYDPYTGEEIEIITGLIKAVLDCQNTDGGWANAATVTASDTDMTAMAIQSLAPYYHSTTVQAAINKGIAFIRSKQDSTTGGFVGANGIISTCSSAQVVTALSTLGIDAADGSWDVAGGHNPLTAILQNYDKTNKNFGETDQLYDSMATEQAAYALVAYDRLISYKNSLYTMSDAFVTVTDPTLEDNEAIGAAKDAVENATYTASQANVTSLSAALTRVNTIIGNLNLNGVTATVTSGVFTPATEGTSSAPNGTDGSYTFTVKLERGIGTPQTTGTLTMAITATEYVAPGAPVDVAVSMQLDDSGLYLAKQGFNVEADLSERYGYADAYNGTKATALDALVAAHIVMFGDDNLHYWLEVSGGSMRKIAGENAVKSYMFINGVLPGSYNVTNAVLTDNDDLMFYLIQDYWNLDLLAWFTDKNDDPIETLTVEARKEFTVTLVGYPPINLMYGYDPEDCTEPIEDAQIVILDVDDSGGFRYGLFGKGLGLTDEDGELKISFEQPGTYILSAYDDSGYDMPFVAPWLEVTVTANAAQQLAEAKATKTTQINNVTNGLNQANYTADSWTALQTAISNALAAVNAATTIADVNAVTVPTTSGLVTLTALNDAKTAKNTLINNVTNGLNQADYTPDSWTALQTAITNALAAVNAAATVADVNAVTVPTTSGLVPLPAGNITITVAVEAFTNVGGGFGGKYIVEPTRMTVPNNYSAADAVKALLTQYYNGQTTWSYLSSGNGSSFYLTGVYLPGYTSTNRAPGKGATIPNYLSEFDEGILSGWMLTVNNIFINVSAGKDALTDGAVVRWQYTCSDGDVGSPAVLGNPNRFANKDALTKKIGEINAAPGTIAAYGTAYTDAMDVLKTLNSTTNDVTDALAALEAVESSAAVMDAAKTAKIADINDVTNGLNAADYTPDSWTALQTAISNAIAAVNAAATIADVNTVQIPSTSGLVTLATELATAKATKLGQINNVTNSLNQADYTPDSWAALQTAIQQAIAAVNAAATVADVNAVTVPSTSGLVLNGTGSGYSIRGKVISITGDTRPATVTLTQNDNTVYTAYTNQNGEYVFNNVIPGDYTLVITKVSYLKYTKTSLIVSNNDVVYKDITLIAGDIDGDGYVSYNDFLIFLANYNKQGARIADAAADINGDGYVDYNDFLEFLSGYNKTAIVE